MRKTNLLKLYWSHALRRYLFYFVSFWYGNGIWYGYAHEERTNM